MKLPFEPARRPLLLGALFLAAGIVTGYYLPLSPAPPLFISGSGLLFIWKGGGQKNRAGKVISKRAIFLFFCLAFLCGYSLLSWQEYKYSSDKAVTSWNERGPVEVTGEIVEPLNSLEGERLCLKPFFINGCRIKYGLIQLERDELPEGIKNGEIISLTMLLETPEEQLNPGGFSYLKYLKKQGVFSLGQLLSEPMIMGRGRRLFKNSLLAAKTALLGIINRLREPYNELLKALLLGERENLPEEWEENFTRAGVNHLLAISGLHVGFVLLIFMGLLKITGLPPGIRNFIISLMLILYIIITGFRPSVFRAGLLAVSFLWAPFFNRRGDLLNLLGFTSLINLCCRPYDLFNIGFQLTYMVLIMIIIWYPLLKKWLFPPLAVSAAAQLGSLPLIAYYFNLISPAGLLTNLWAIPLIGLVVSLGLIGLLLGLIHPFFSWLIFQPAAFLLFLVGRGTGLTAALPFSSFEVPSPPPLILIASTLFLLTLPLLLQQAVLPFNRLRRERRLYCSLTLLLLLLLGNFSLSLVNNQLEIIFFAVGQGDSILFHFPGGRTMLVDGGGPVGLKSSRGEKVLLPYLKKRGIKRLDLVFGTHFDADHVKGLEDILDSRQVDLLVIPVNFENNQLAEAILTAAARRKVPVRAGIAGEYFQLGDARVDILAPRLDDFYISNNESSLVLRVRYGRFRIILTGDLGKEGELRLVNSRLELESDILKLGHHGSETSSAAAFLRAVSPREAVVSVGPNNYGHPAAAVLRRVEKQGIRLWRTDRQGAIIISTDGRSYTIKGFRRAGE